LKRQKIKTSGRDHKQPHGVWKEGVWGLLGENGRWSLEKPQPVGGGNMSISTGKTSGWVQRDDLEGKKKETIGQKKWTAAKRDTQPSEETDVGKGPKLKTGKC